MYTRSYAAEDERLKIPENYDGVMLREERGDAHIPEEQPAPPQRQDAAAEDIHNPAWEPGIPRERENESIPTFGKAQASGGFLDGIFNFLPSFNIFGKGQISAAPISLGSEEILIIGVALFLLLSKSGDKECALMLLFLLLVH